MRIVWIFAALLSVVAGNARAKDWKVFCMPEKHLDVGFNYPPADSPGGRYAGSVEDIHNIITLRALYARSLTEKYPPAAQFHWFFDAAWQLEQVQKYLPEHMNEIRQLVNRRQFGYNPINVNLHAMYLTNEQLLRMMSDGRDLERRGFRRSYVATHGDVPTVSWGYASALASAGIKYFLKGTWYNSPYSRNLEHVGPAPLFRWTGPDGQQVLCFYYDGYSVMSHGAGMNRRYESLSEEAVMACARRYEKLAADGVWPYDAFPMFGSEGDWGFPDRRNSDFIRDWNKTHPEIQLRMATPADFFEYIEANFGTKIPDGGSGGWGISYDLVESNAVKPGAGARGNDDVLVAAEAFAASAQVRFGAPYPAASFREAWQKQVLYHEHSFGMLDAAGPQGRRQYAWKTQLTERAAELGQSALTAAVAALAAHIPNNGEERFAVFNALSFPRSGIVQVEVDADPKSPAVHVVEVATNREVPTQTERVGAKARVRFFAKNVPALGYCCYSLRRQAGRSTPRRATADAVTRVLQNDCYRVMLAPNGSIASLFDKQLRRELLDTQSLYRGNQFIFKNNAWEESSPRTAEIRAIDLGPIGARLEVHFSPTAIFPAIITRYTLYDGLKRLEIENRFTKQPGKSASNETVFYAFPFAVPQGKFFLDIPGVIARYPEDFRSETDWTIMPAQSFAAVANDELSVLVATREAPNFEFSAMRKFFDHPTQPDLSTTTLFAQPLTKQTVNKDDYDWKGGDYVFHYAVTSDAGPFDPSTAVRRAAEFQQGLIPARLAQRTGNMPSETSFLTIDSEQIMLSALKQADDGQGLIVRVWNPTGNVQTARVAFPGYRILSATATDILERDLDQHYALRNQAVTISCRPRQFLTLRVKIRPEKM